MQRQRAERALAFEVVGAVQPRVVDLVANASREGRDVPFQAVARFLSTKVNGFGEVARASRRAVHGQGTDLQMCRVDGDLRELRQRQVPRLRRPCQKA